MFFISNIEFNDKNTEVVKNLCKEEKFFTPLWSDHSGYVEGYLCLTTKEAKKLEELHEKCGVAYTEKLEHYLAEVATKGDNNALSALNELEEKILSAPNLPLEEERGYFYIKKEGYQNFSHHSAEEAQFYYWAENYKELF